MAFSYCCVLLNIMLNAMILMFIINTVVADGRRRVLLISMSGFRSDYIQKYNTPNFDDLAAKGTRAPYLTGAFVSGTYPSHYTIATGLYPESHGIISDSMYDPEFDASFNKNTTESRWWDGGEPLWVTAIKNEQRSAVYFWPGGETEIRGHRPIMYFRYDESVSFRGRIDAVLSWLSDSIYDIELAMVYFHEPGKSGQLYGPNSEEVKQAVEMVDDVLGYLMDQLTEKDMWNEVNIIVTSDHGMAEIDTPTRLIDISYHIDMNAIDRIPTTGAVANILPKPGMVEEIIANLSNVDHLTVYRKQDIPDRWYYKNNRRILPILVVAEEGWVIGKDAHDYYVGYRGANGYDNDLLSMKPIFYARGPNFRVGYEAASFSSVDIYPLVCEILEILPAPNNGSLHHTTSFLVGTPSSGFSKPDVSILVIITSYFICLCLSVTTGT